MQKPKKARTLSVNSNNRIAALLITVIFFTGGCSSTPPVAHEKPAAPAARHDLQPDNTGPNPAELAQHDYEQALKSLDSGRDKYAKQQLLALTETYPEFSGPYANLGILYFREGDMKSAEEILTKAVQINPQNAMAYNQLGILYRHTGRFDEARQAYNHALQINPDYANAHLNLGILCDLFLLDPNQALQHYERYMELSPDGNEKVSLWLADLKHRIADKNLSTNEIQ